MSYYKSESEYSYYDVKCYLVDIEYNSIYKIDHISLKNETTNSNNGTKTSIDTAYLSFKDEKISNWINNFNNFNMSDTYFYFPKLGKVLLLKNSMLVNFNYEYESGTVELNFMYSEYLDVIDSKIKDVIRHIKLNTLLK
jgi:hypothetical protein